MSCLIYSLVPNVTTGWFIWNFFTKIVSQQTCVLYETCFVKKFQMSQRVVTFGTREYMLVKTLYKFNNTSYQYILLSIKR